MDTKASNPAMVKLSINIIATSLVRRDARHMGELRRLRQAAASGIIPRYLYSDSTYSAAWMLHKYFIEYLYCNNLYQQPGGVWCRIHSRF